MYSNVFKYIGTSVSALKNINPDPSPPDRRPSRVNTGRGLNAYLSNASRRARACPT